MAREKRMLVDVSAKTHRKFKIEAVKRGRTMSSLLCEYMEAYVKANNPGDGDKKKIDNPEEEAEKVKGLVEEIFKSREAREVLKNPEKEPVDELLEVHTVKKPDEIHAVKESEKEPEKELVKEPEKELEKAMAAENNPGPEKEKKTFGEKLNKVLARVLPPWY